LIITGNRQTGFADGVSAAARFNKLMHIVVDTQGTIFVADKVNHCVWQVAPDKGAVMTLMGVGGEKDFTNQQHAAARFNKWVCVCARVCPHVYDIAQPEIPPSHLMSLKIMLQVG